MKKGFISNKLRHNKKPPDDSRTVQKNDRIPGERFTWLNLQNPDRPYMEQVAEEYSLNALNVEDCLTRFELPKLDSYDDHFFVILHFPPLVQKSGVSRNSQLSVFAGRNFLITVHQGDLGPLVELAEAYRNSANEQASMSPGKMLHKIIDALVDDLLHTSRKIIANLDEMEDGVFDEAKSVARSIALLRREINKLRRMANPLKKFVMEIARGVERLSEGSDKELRLYFDDVIDHIDKVIETLEESRETMEIYKDTDFVLSTEKTNKVLGMLTIIFTLAIPATVIGTFYGMNVSLPGAEGGMLLGPHTAFIIIIVASAIPAALMFAYFKKLGWISR